MKWSRGVESHVPGHHVGANAGARAPPPASRELRAHRGQEPGALAGAPRPSATPPRWWVLLDRFVPVHEEARLADLPVAISAGEAGDELPGLDRVDRDPSGIEIRRDVVVILVVHRLETAVRRDVHDDLARVDGEPLEFLTQTGRPGNRTPEERGVSQIGQPGSPSEQAGAALADLSRELARRERPLHERRRARVDPAAQSPRGGIAGDAAVGADRLVV